MSSSMLRLLYLVNHQHRDVCQRCRDVIFFDEPHRRRGGHLRGRVSRLEEAVRWAGSPT